MEKDILYYFSEISNFKFSVRVCDRFLEVNIYLHNWKEGLDNCFILDAKFLAKSKELDIIQVDETMPREKDV